MCIIFWKIKKFDYNLFWDFYFLLFLHMKTSETSKNPEKKFKRSSKIKSVVTSLALLLGAASCDNIPNDQIILNPSSESLKMNIEYQYFQWSAWTEIVDYDITVHKDWDFYKWEINQKNWIFRTKTTLQSGNIDNLFRDISREVDNEQISDETKVKKDEKLDFAKKVYKDSILNRETPAEDWEIRIKYEPK